MKTTVGNIDPEVLAFTVGKDPELDLALAEADCIGSAAHATMLSRVPGKPKIITLAQRKKLISALVRIMRDARRGSFRIRTSDQDVHMAVERVLTGRLGALGKKIHTARSRNDQAALDLRLYARKELLRTMEEAAALAGILLDLAARHQATPMVGRTHTQPAMPSSVGTWASAYAESLLDDMALLIDAYELNDQSPLGAAAGYGVPLPINPDLTAKLLGFSRACQNPLHAINARGKCESVILFAMGQVMLSLSRISADLILFTIPEFGYFSLPPEYCTGSSIMPRKRNPDVLELIRAKAAGVLSRAFMVSETVRGLPGGYNRDLQETKLYFIEGIADTRASLRILARLMKKLKVNRKALRNGFTPAVFAAERALGLAAKGMPFRDAYDLVKKDEAQQGPCDAPGAGRGASAHVDLDLLRKRVNAATAFTKAERKHYCSAISRLLGVKYQELGG